MTTSKTVIITGITGQDGAYLSLFLLDKGYRVIGAYRRTSTTNVWRLEELGILKHPALELVEHNLSDMGSCVRLIEQYRPQEIYNLAAQSFVGVSFSQPVHTCQVTGLGVLNMLEAVRMVDRTIRFYQASSSEMFGGGAAAPQDESTPFYPRSPYGTAKAFGHWMTINYREAYGIFGVSGILFNHESPLRGLEFVTRKITEGVARIHRGDTSVLELGNLNARRDWGYARDYVYGMWLMMQAPRPESYVLATGRAESVRDFVTMAFSEVDRRIVWEGDGEQEIGRDAVTGQLLVKVNSQFYRAAEVNSLVGNAGKAWRELHWKSRTGLEELCRMMVEADLRRVSNGRSL